MLFELRWKIVLLFCATSATSIKNKTALNGFPLGVTCKSVDINGPSNNDTVWCTIETEDRVLFNKSVTWAQRSDGGSVDADKNLENKIVKVSLIWRNITVSEEFRMSISEPNAFNCSYLQDVHALNEREGSDLSLGCSSYQLDVDMTTNQYQSFTTAWYHECELLSQEPSTTHEYESDSRSGETRFDSVRLKKVSFDVSPGIYHCVVQYKGKKLRAQSHRVCVQERRNYGRVPLIKSGNGKYTPAPGEDVTLTCHGIFAVRFSDVTWIRLSNDYRMLCFTAYDPELCPWSGPLTKVCERPQKGGSPIIPRGNFTASFTIRNVNESHSGRYRCEINSFGEHQYANFTIDVTPRPQTDLMIILLVAFGGLAIVIILILICRKRKINGGSCRIKRYKETKESDKLTTCLIYSDDVLSWDRKNQPYRYVKDWLTSSNCSYHDLNPIKTFNNAGNIISDSTFEVLDNCLSVIVILTPKLLRDNAADIFETYKGFQNKAGYNLPIVFICTKEMEKEFERNAKLDGNEAPTTVRESCATFKKFMERNTVIHWEPDEISRFNNALFDALSKVQGSLNAPKRNIRENGKYDMTVFREQTHKKEDNN